MMASAESSVSFQGRAMEAGEGMGASPRDMPSRLHEPDAIEEWKMIRRIAIPWESPFVYFLGNKGILPLSSGRAGCGPSVGWRYCGSVRVMGSEWVQGGGQ